MPVGPGVLLASERAAIAHRRVLASECARRSTAMRRADDDHRFPLHVTHISLPPAGETGANAGDRVAPPADSLSLFLLLPPSLSLSLPPSLSLSNAILVIYAQVPRAETRISWRILSSPRRCSIKHFFFLIYRH